MSDHAVPSVRYDRWGRYLLPHPETGREQPWTRATTVAGTLADRYGLERWAQRNIALGLGKRRDLYAQAAACTAADTTKLSEIVDAAQEAAASQVGANLGLALHRFTERLDRGETGLSVPDPWAADVRAYQEVMAGSDIRILDGWVERIVVVPELNIAGTCDRVCHRPGWTRPRVGDLKTGRDVIRYSMVEIALQLAIYAHATHWYDPVERRLKEMPDMDRDRALVMHLPVGAASCTLYEVDIAAGWEAVHLAMQVRAWRKRKDLATPFNAPPTAAAPAIVPQLPDDEAAAPDETGSDRIAWLRSRVEAIVAAGHGALLATNWPESTPTLKQGGLTAAHVDAAARACSTVERETGLPFPKDDPEPGVSRELRTSAFDDLVRPLGDDQLAEAALRLAYSKEKGTEDSVRERLAAVVTELASVNGAIYALHGPQGWTVQPTDQAAEQMASAAGGKSEALRLARRLAKQLGLRSPRSLAVAATEPLLAALVSASRHEPADSPTSPSGSNSR